MPSHRHAAAPPQSLTLAPGHSLWLRLGPGSTLYAAHGDIAVHWAPQACGDTLHTPPRTVLSAGEALPCHRLAAAALVRLYNPTLRAAELQWIAGAPEPAWWRRAWQQVRSALDHRDRGTQAPACRGACPVAR